MSGRLRRTLLAILLAAAPLPLLSQAPSGCANGGRTGVKVAVGGAAVAGNLLLYQYFKQAWWSGERADRWFVRDDWDQDFRDQDKLGHVYGGYHLTRIGKAMLSAACVSDRKAVYWSAAYAAAFQLQIEIWDGFYETYGFSPGDLVANTAGAGLAVLHQLRPGTLVVRPTISYAPTAAYRRRSEPGHNDAPRATIDYSGQTYWLSLDLDAVLPERARAAWPDVLRLSVGHSITDWIDPETGRAQRAQRKLLLSVDLDASKLPGDFPVWREVKHTLGWIRLPAPALQLAPSLDGVRWYR